MTHPSKSSFLSGTLPSYKNPPVNEVVCGMRFQVPDKLRIPHIGFLWDKFRADYPIVQHAPPIASVKGEISVDEATGIPLPRVWFINKSDDQLVQFQFDRFYFNWRRRQSDYPRYDHVIRNFERALNTLVSFFGEFELGELKPIEYELSYINHIPKGQGWNTIDDLPGIFPDFVWKQTKTRFLPNPEKVAWQTEFPLQEKKGYLIVNLKQATRTEDKVPLLVLELKTRRIGESRSKEAIREWFDLAHEWIVRGFTDLTTPEIQKIWEREDNA
jgi:uncharacterized protein (TIGR04255 family)